MAGHLMVTAMETVLQMSLMHSPQIRVNGLIRIVMGWEIILMYSQPILVNGPIRIVMGWETILMYSQPTLVNGLIQTVMVWETILISVGTPTQILLLTMRDVQMIKDSMMMMIM